MGTNLISCTSQKCCEEQISEQDEGQFNAAEVDNNPQMSLTEVLQSHVVVWNLECEYGLLEELRMSGCLTEDMIEQISSDYNRENRNSGRLRYERNKKLIKYINQSNLEKFLTGLRNVQQEHIATYIVRNGERGAVGEDWPIDDTMLEAIDHMKDKFVDEISKELHDDLFSQGCINELHRRSINIKSTRVEMNKQLLTIITRRSDGHLTKFLKCLEKDHKHLISQLNRIKASPSFVLIKGLTVCNNVLFVVRESQSKVNVYDSNSLTSSRDINIPGMKLPGGLAGCAHNKALYISDSGLCIHTVDLTNNSVARWAIREDYAPCDLSMTAEHNLLVTVRISVISDESAVVEYTSEGQPVREIRLDRSIDARQAVQLSSNQFIVCHGLGDSSLHRVCQINAEGQIIKSYGRERGEGEGQLNQPQSLTIDNNSKRIFVADTSNHRILLFDSDLTYLGQVHTPRDLELPWCLYFDSSTDRLFVGEASGRVIVIGPTV